MDDSESLTSNLMIQAGSKHVASRNAEMDDLESLTSKLSIQAAPSNIASSDAAPQGGGFSHHPAGISHPDANGVGKHYYADVEERLYKDPDFLDRFESHQRKMAELTALYKGWLTLAAKEETLEEEERLVAQALERALEEKAQQKERLEMLKATEPFMKLLQLAKDLGLR
jgi:hypothetical protein